MKNKRGVSTVVVSLLLILIIIVAIGIVWTVIKGMIDESTERIALGKITLDVGFQKVEIYNQSNNVSIKVKREVGRGEMIGLKFVFYTSIGSEVFQEYIGLRELGEKTFMFHLDSLLVDDLVKISIVPVLETSSGKEFLGDNLKTYHVKDGTITSGGCIPDCQGYVCGMDPVCGTLDCGSCNATHPNCNNGVCEETGCIPDCQGYVCGMDPVCGTLDCGSCSGGETCQLGTCVPTTALTCADITHPNCVEITSCGLLDQIETYYLLVNDVQSDDSCFEVHPSSITHGEHEPVILDLNGYTITFGGASGVNQKGIYIWGDYHYRPNIEIKNGNIKQGAGNGTQCNSISGGYWSPNKEYHHLNASTWGWDCSNIGVFGGKNISIHDNYLEQNVSYVTDRQGKMISQIGVSSNGKIGSEDTSPGGKVYIYNNVLKGKGQVGIGLSRSSASDWGNYDFYNKIQDLEIYNNHIQMEGVVANAYAMILNGYSANEYYTPLIYDNHIEQTNARGIDIDAIDDLLGLKGAHFYNNYIDTQQGCLEDNRGGTFQGYVCGTHTLRIRSSDSYYRVGGGLQNPYGENSDNWFYNNTFIVRQGNVMPDGTLSGWGYGLRLSVRDYNQSLNMTFEDNKFIAITNSTYGHSLETDGDVAAVYINGVIPGNNIIFKNNKFESNYRPLWIGGSEIKFIDNEIIKSGVENNYYENIRVGFWIERSSGNLFINQTFTNAPSFGETDDVFYRSTDVISARNISVNWYLDIQGPSNTQVDIGDVFGTPVFSGQTDASGNLRVNLTEFTEECNAFVCPPSSTTRIDYTPHTVSVAGYAPRQVTINQNRFEVF